MGVGDEERDTWQVGDKNQKQSVQTTRINLLPPVLCDIMYSLWSRADRGRSPRANPGGFHWLHRLRVAGAIALADFEINGNQNQECSSIAKLQTGGKHDGFKGSTTSDFNVRGHSGDWSECGCRCPTVPTPQLCSGLTDSPNLHSYSYDLSYSRRRSADLLLHPRVRADWSL